MAPPKKDRTRIEWDEKPDTEDPVGFDGEAGIGGFAFFVQCDSPSKWVGSLRSPSGDDYSRGLIGTSLVEAEQKMLTKAHELSLVTTMKIGAMLHSANPKKVASKRGRPKKVAIKRGRPKKVASKRGRPKKVASKRGRPKKTDSETRQKAA